MSRLRTRTKSFILGVLFSLGMSIPFIEYDLLGKTTNHICEEEDENV